MRWEGREKSRNVEDHRGKSMKRVAGGIGIGTILMLGLALFFGGDVGQILNQVATQSQQGQSQIQQSGAQPGNRADDALAEFVGVVLKDTEDVWNKIFAEQLGQRYREPKLVIFDGQIGSACGHASAATGPFYCPGDEKVYIDLSFYKQLRDRFKAPGDFAMAYVVAHEVAHHVQKLLGYTDFVHSKKGRVSQKEYNDLSVRLELQADYLAGVWARYGHEMNGFLEEGDIDEALNAAHAIGDDRIQKQSQGYVVPDSFTHGTSEQRARWFTKGVQNGTLKGGDTFNARVL